jgi:hypothetical protein
MPRPSVSVFTYKGQIVRIEPMSLYIGPTLPLLPPDVRDLKQVSFTSYSVPLVLNGNLMSSTIRRYSLYHNFHRDYGSHLFRRPTPRRARDEEAEEIDSTSDESHARRRAVVRARLAPRSDESISSSD